MMLKSEQRRLFALMLENARCFIRLCDDDCALWVSDLPRRTDELPDLTAHGYLCTLDENCRLWYIDWTEKRRCEMLQTLSGQLPPFPKHEKHHEAYALCRFWLMHSGVWDDRTAPLIRRVLKLTAQSDDQLLRAIPALHGMAAEMWRNGRVSAYPAGQILCDWLKRKENDE